MARFTLNPDYLDFLSACHDQGVEYLVVGGQAVIFHGYVRTTKDIYRIELLTDIPRVEFSEYYSRRIEVEVDGVQVPFIQIDDLIANKRAVGRPQDLADVSVLTRRK